MRLTLHTDFALRVLIQVGLNDGNLTTIKDIAQTFGISKAHLMKVVQLTTFIKCAFEIPKVCAMSLIVVRLPSLSPT